MVETTTYQVFFQFLQTVSIMVGIAYYVMSLRNQEKTQRQTLETRQAQLFMQIYLTFTNPSFQQAYNEIKKWTYENLDDFDKNYGYDVNPESYKYHSSLSFFFEGVGVLVMRKLIDPALVDDLMSGPVIAYWEKMKPYYVEYRTRFDWPQIGEYIEYLYNNIKPIAERQKTELKNNSTR